MNVLRRGQVDVVLFNHLKTDSFIYHIARKAPGLFCRDLIPKAEQHWCMSIPDNMDRFWEACSHNRRKKLRKYTRKLEKRYPGQVKMVTFSRQEEVAEGLRIAADISADTYQRAFGGGLVDDAPTRAIFKEAAKNGWLRIYILFVADEPCAFKSILKYGRTCFADVTAYSPEWMDWNVGSILFLKIVEQICGDPVVDSLDFGFGDSQHKQVGDSRQWAEASVFIFAPRSFPVFVNLIRTLTLAMSMLAQHAVNGLGIHNLVQRYRRRRITRKRGFRTLIRG
jgi:CelD/BcsL family acetyltransferase involved in cellulose biosynthesis